MAIGAAISVAHRAVDAVMGPRTIRFENVCSQAPEGSTAPMDNTAGGVDACNIHSKAFQDPNIHSKPQKEGAETEQFWSLLGGKCEYPSQKIGREPKNDPHLFSCTYTKGNLKVTEIFNFSTDDLMTDDVFILDCHSEIFVWVGQLVDSKCKMQALNIGEKFLEHDFLMENLSRGTPIFVVSKGNEPTCFTRSFDWDSAKSADYQSEHIGLSSAMKQVLVHEVIIKQASTTAVYD